MPENIIIPAILLIVALLVVVFVMSYIKAAPDEAIIVSGIQKQPRIIIGRAGLRCN